MDEVRRFLRYTLPGLSAVIQLLIGLLITNTEIIGEILSAKDLSKSLGIILAIFIGSGGLGYLFANIYFSLYWSWPFSRLVAIDHLTLLESLKKEKIEIVDYSGKEYEKDLSKREAWTILTQYWHSNIKENKKIEGVNIIIDRLTDVTHGLGATFIGSLSALFSWIIIHLSTVEGSAPFFTQKVSIVLLVWVILIVVFGFAYRRTNLALQSMANSTVTDIICSEYQPGNKIQIYYQK